MGTGSSLDTNRFIILKVGENVQKVVYSMHSSTKDVQDLICQISNIRRNSDIALRTGDGAYVTLSPAMPQNDIRDPYIVEILRESPSNSTSSSRELDVVGAPLMEQIASQFTRAFRREGNEDLEERIKTLERRMDIEGLKSVEVDKCKNSLQAIEAQIRAAQKKFVNHNGVRGMPLDDESCSKVKSQGKSPPYTKYTLSNETIEYLKQATFDIWQWEPNEMLSLLEHMYHELGLVKEFNINGVTLKKWLLCIQESYRNNPFHNFRHCFCVTQMMYGIIHQLKLHEQISKEDIGILITACICHDLDHPGTNNTYQINARTDLAIRYNDISPLENHHCSIAFKIFANPDTNIFANCDPDTFKRIRAGITVLILATDMARHAEILESFKLQSEGGKFDIHDPEHLEALKMVLIKCCDISNEVRPLELSEPWLDCLLEEYFNQSDREKEMGLPVAPFMDREKVTKPTAQIGFIKFVLLPMFESVGKVFPQINSVIVDPLTQAKEHWENMKIQEDLLQEQVKSIGAN